MEESALRSFVLGPTHVAEAVPLPFVTAVTSGLQIILRRHPTEEVTLQAVAVALEKYRPMVDPQVNHVDRGVSYRGSVTIPLSHLWKFLAEFCPYAAFEG
eukprot:RCo028764